MTGGDGNDTLNGGAGADTLSGGGGNDIYVIDNVGDIVVELAGGGTDTVQSSISYSLADNAESLTLTGAEAINGTGNALANTLTGNAAANTLVSGDGNDSLNGGAGADTMFGGAGNDLYTVDNAGDIVTELVGEGTDTVQSSIRYALGDNVENLTLTGTLATDGTGNALDNSLTGNAAANTLNGGDGGDILNGGAGIDTLIGGAGNDAYVVDNIADVVVEFANEGTDTVSASVTHTLASNIENLSLTGTAAINAKGNELDNLILGNSASNTLVGAAGNDTLDGGAGNDTLDGGAGNDTYVLGRGYGSDTAQENDSTTGNRDVLQFMGGIATDQIWLRQVANNLEVSVIGTADKMTISNWYLGNRYHVEEFKTSDGKVLLDSQVQNLVQAMAGFAPPAAGQTTLTQSYQNALQPTIAANWV